MSFDPEKFDKPDEAHPTLGDGYFLKFPKGETPRTYYVCPIDFWFTKSPKLIATAMEFTIDHKKLSNLVDFGDMEIWGYLSLLPKELRSTPAVADEWINFVLGPLAAAMKVKGLSFEERDAVIHPGALLVMFEAMSLDLVPASKKKELYEALFARFNAAFYPIPIISEADARLVFYEILADVVAPIFDEASGDELAEIIKKVLADNPKQADEAKTDPKVVGWVMGQVMRAYPTKLDPKVVREAILALV